MRTPRWGQVDVHQRDRSARLLEYGDVMAGSLQRNGGTEPPTPPPVLSPKQPPAQYHGIGKGSPMVVSSAALFYIEQHVQILAWNPSTVNSFVARSEAPVRREKVGGDLTQGTTSNGYSVPPVERAVRLLCYLGAGNTCRNLSTASRDLNINRTTLLRLIHTLLNLSMIEELGDGACYRLGVGLVSLGAQALEGRDLVRVCQPVCKSLRTHRNVCASRHSRWA